MSLLVKLSNHPQRPRFEIRLEGFRKSFYANDNDEIALAVDHYFRGEGTDPRHWGEGMPSCPLCKKG